MAALGPKLISDGGPLNKSKDSDLLSTSYKSLIYPQDLFAHGKQAFIFFNVREAPKGLTPVSQPLGSVCLYMPSSLRVSYGAGYTPVTQPFEKLKETATTLWNSLTDAYNNRNSVDFTVDGVISKLKEASDDPGARWIAHAFIKKHLSADYAAEFRQKLGIVINPWMALVYEHPEFRTFEFEFEFFPRNSDEAENVRRIIKLFKLAMHPTKTGDAGNLIWGYPCVFDVFLCTPWTDKMFMIKRSVLTSADVDYAAGGIQSFFKDGHPTHTKLTLKFKEMELLTREEVYENY